VHRNLYTNVLAILFITKVEQPHIQPLMNKQNVYSYYMFMTYYSAIKRSEVLIHVTTCMNLANTLSNKGSHKGPHSVMIAFIWSGQKRWTHKDREKIRNCLELGF
jgi:hypothetical protein